MTIQSIEESIKVLLSSYKHITERNIQGVIFEFDLSDKDLIVKTINQLTLIKDNMEVIEKIKYNIFH